jgi:hypothetical protein
MSLSAEFDLPLTLLVVRAKTGLDPGTTRRLLGVFRTAEFVTRPSPSELAVILPNTGPDGARAPCARGPARRRRRPGDSQATRQGLRPAGTREGRPLAAREPDRPAELPAVLILEGEVFPPGI